MGQSSSTPSDTEWLSTGVTYSYTSSEEEEEDDTLSKTEWEEIQSEVKTIQLLTVENVPLAEEDSESSHSENEADTDSDKKDTNKGDELVSRSQSEVNEEKDKKKENKDKEKTVEDKEENKSKKVPSLQLKKEVKFDESEKSEDQSKNRLKSTPSLRRRMLTHIHGLERGKLKVPMKTPRGKHYYKQPTLTGKLKKLLSIMLVNAKREKLFQIAQQLVNSDIGLSHMKKDSTISLTGKELIDWLMSKNIAPNREDALKIGNELIKNNVVQSNSEPLDSDSCKILISSSVLEEAGKLSEETIVSLMKITHFDRLELTSLWKEFTSETESDNGTYYWTVDSLKKKMPILEGYDDIILVVFRAFLSGFRDKTRFGFEQFVIALSTITHGSDVEKAAVVTRMCLHSESSTYVKRPHVRKLANKIHQLMKKLKLETINPRDTIDQIFSKNYEKSDQSNEEETEVSNSMVADDKSQVSKEPEPKESKSLSPKSKDSKEGSESKEKTPRSKDSKESKETKSSRTKESTESGETKSSKSKEQKEPKSPRSKDSKESKETKSSKAKDSDEPNETKNKSKEKKQSKETKDTKVSNEETNSLKEAQQKIAEFSKIIEEKDAVISQLKNRVDSLENILSQINKLSSSKNTNNTLKGSTDTNKEWESIWKDKDTDSTSKPQSEEVTSRAPSEPIKIEVTHAERSTENKKMETILERSDLDEDDAKSEVSKSESIVEDEKKHKTKRKRNENLVSSLDRNEFEKRIADSEPFCEFFGLFPIFVKKFVNPLYSVANLYVPKEGQVKQRGLKCSKHIFILLRGHFLAIFENKSTSPYLVVNLSYAKVWSNNFRKKHFEIYSRRFKGYFITKTEEERDDWVITLQQHASPPIPYRFRSFAPIRKGVHARWFVNGKQYFDALVPVLEEAKKRICITDWFLSDGLPLKRDSKLPDKLKENRLDKILLRAANRGVKVYILLWKNIETVFAIGAEATATRLNSRHPNIVCLTHRGKVNNIPWSHHQKSLIVDEKIAFVGGLDLCYGRYDDDNYRVADQEGVFFPGADYTNVNIVGENNLHPEKDQVDRKLIPRMPWHDIQCQVSGAAAMDVQRNFIERWNFAEKRAQNKKTEQLMPLTSEEIDGGIKLDYERLGYSNCHIQVLRSFPGWGGFELHRKEDSIYRGYIQLIREARYYIYIENQYFISQIHMPAPQNRILKALKERISKAIRNKETFRVYIVLPVYPAGNIADATTQTIIKTTNKTCKLIQKQLFEEHRFSDVGQYIQFFSLRNQGMLNARPVTEQIYIHAKLIIVDDRKVIIGSANINDRSMLGSRDSEICCMIEQEPCDKGPMDGNVVPVSPYARDLRLYIWKSFLGLSDDSLIHDPTALSTYNLWKETAENNTNIYRGLFSHLPDDVLLPQDFPSKYWDTIADDWVYTDVKLRQYLEKVKEIRGFVVAYPINFLSGLKSSFLDITKFSVAKDTLI